MFSGGERGLEAAGRRDQLGRRLGTRVRHAVVLGSRRWPVRSGKGLSSGLLAFSAKLLERQHVLLLGSLSGVRGEMTDRRHCDIRHQAAQFPGNGVLAWREVGVHRARIPHHKVAYEKSQNHKVLTMVRNSKPAWTHNASAGFCAVVFL